jgi:putative glutamine amidotransferase
MPPTPRIGITMEIGSPDESRLVYELPCDYSAAVIRNGGLPIVLPPTKNESIRRQMIDMIDALIVPGGMDIDPALYGQKPHPKTKMLSPERADFDLAMLNLAQERKLPTLGICLGCQIMNVHRKGSLHQHIPDAPYESPLTHSRPGDRTNFHEVTIQPHTALARILELDTLRTNSRHHQSLDELGENLRATANALDGVIEAIEDPNLPFWLAVQWHPENLENTPHDRLFQALVNAAHNYRRQRQ